MGKVTTRFQMETRTLASTSTGKHMAKALIDGLTVTFTVVLLSKVKNKEKGFGARTIKTIATLTKATI